MNSVKKTAVAVVLGSVVMSSAFAVNAQTNPFGFEAMDAGYQIVGSEGKCGEAKCGADMKKAAAEKAKEGKCGEAKCGAEMKKAAADKAHEGKCGEAKCGADVKKAAMAKAHEGKCGEAKCGADMKKTAEKVDAKVEAVKKEMK
ncbi:HvfA family oxazolone/thioamide-modified RiPP metallophore [Shewanella baltica]|uniref:HvfA family oxazolone/thioamide-modified RiPP metallophore n=1 Tax=Shewanella baltica TaxID=62322 RepID=UPI003D7AAFE2